MTDDVRRVFLYTSGRIDVLGPEMETNAVIMRDEDYDRLRAELAEKDKRIAELESRDIGEDCQEWDRANGIYHITTEQINWAWSEVAEYRDEILHETCWPNDIINWCLDVFDSVVEIAFGKLGIVACPGCGGSGVQSDVYDLGKVIHEQSCAMCNGNGWVMEER